MASPRQLPKQKKPTIGYLVIPGGHFEWEVLGKGFKGSSLITGGSDKRSEKVDGQWNLMVIFGDS